MDRYLGEIRIFAFGFVPRNFTICDGSKLSKTQYAFLYNLLGDTYTQDMSDSSTFAIPDLRNRFVKHPGTAIRLGEQKGNNEVVLSMAQMPEHTHEAKIIVDNTKGGDETKNAPKDGFLNNNAANFSREASENTFLGGISQENVGNSEPINIKNANLKMVYAICIRGIYPTNNDTMIGFIGEIRIWPTNNIIPNGWALCDGSTYSIGGNSALSSIIGAHYGTGTNGVPELPDFRNRFAVGASEITKVAEKGGKTNIRLDKNQLPPHKHNLRLAVNNDTNSVTAPRINDAFINKDAGPFSTEIGNQANLGGMTQEDRGGFEEIDITNSCVGINYIICISGNFGPATENAYLGEVRIYAGFNTSNIDRSGFALCSGQSIPINAYQSLFSLLRTTYGGNGTSAFNLPDLRNKIPLCLSNFYEIGKALGANQINLKPENLPEHNHNVRLAGNHTADGRLVEIPNGILNNDAGQFSNKQTDDTYLGGVEETTFVVKK